MTGSSSIVSPAGPFAGQCTGTPDIANQVCSRRLRRGDLPEVIFLIAPPRPAPPETEGPNRGERQAVDPPWQPQHPSGDVEIAAKVLLHLAVKIQMHPLQQEGGDDGRDAKQVSEGGFLDLHPQRN